MTQKDKSILVLKALLITEFKETKEISKDYLIKKLESIFTLANPEVMLGEEAEKLFSKLVDEERRKGNII